MASLPRGSWSVGMNREALGYAGFTTHSLIGAPNLGRLSLYTTYTYLVEPMKHMLVNWAIFYKYRDWIKRWLKPTAQTVPITRCHSESSQFMIAVATVFLINHRFRHKRGWSSFEDKSKSTQRSSAWKSLKCHRGQIIEVLTWRIPKQGNISINANI